MVVSGDQAGGGLYDPLRSDILGGYNYLASQDDGTWAYMLTPGNTGLGMMVWSMARYCGSCGDTVEQWLLPVLVRWVAITNPHDQKVDGNLIEEFYGSDDTSRGPMVGILEIWIPEREYECPHWSYTVHKNLDIGEDCDGDCGGSHYTDFGMMVGLAPVHAVIPVETSLFATWLPKLSKAWNKHDYVFSNYHICTCFFDGIEITDCLVYQWEKEHADHKTLAWNEPAMLNDRWKREAECNCTYHGFMQEFWDLVSSTPDFVQEVDDDLFAATWAYALDRYFQGWKWLDRHTPSRIYPMEDERKAWLIYFSRDFSPYWGPTGLDEYLRMHGLTQYAA